MLSRVAATARPSIHADAGTRVGRSAVVQPTMSAHATSAAIVVGADFTNCCPIAVTETRSGVFVGHSLQCRARTAYFERSNQTLCPRRQQSASPPRRAGLPIVGIVADFVSATMRPAAATTHEIDGCIWPWSEVPGAAEVGSGLTWTFLSMFVRVCDPAAVGRVRERLLVLQ